MFRQSPQAAAARLEQLAAEFLAGPANDLEMAGGREPAFGPALFGYAAGDDPVWLDFKEAVAPRYWSPKEAFEKTFPGQAAVAGDLSVVAWALPQTEATLRDQRAAKEFACERWVHSRYLSQPRVVDGLARFLLDHLGREGVAAVSPDHLPDFTHWPSDRFTITSPWSQRHAAFAAGLGTFGL